MDRYYHGGSAHYNSKHALVTVKHLLKLSDLSPEARRVCGFILSQNPYVLAENIRSNYSRHFVEKLTMVVKAKGLYTDTNARMLSLMHLNRPNHINIGISVIVIVRKYKTMIITDIGSGKTIKTDNSREHIVHNVRKALKHIEPFEDMCKNHDQIWDFWNMMRLVHSDL